MLSRAPSKSEVKYERQREGLHRKLFAKVPHAMTKDTKSDRLSSSVLKQPMDFFEINTYRVAETLLPMQTPKFYYGDISNETSNYILITERIPYSGFSGKTVSGVLKPFKLAPYASKWVHRDSWIPRVPLREYRSTISL